MLLAKEIYLKSVCVRISDTLFQGKINLYVLIMHSRHVTYLQKICTIFHLIVSLIAAIFAAGNIINNFSRGG